MGTSVAADSLLSPRQDRDLPARLARSSAANRGVHTMDEFNAWYLRQKRIHRVETQRTPFAALDGWGFAKDTGNLGHDGGGRYSIEGMRILAWQGPICEWYQPVVNQHGGALHGLLVKEHQGILHCLVRATVEPGHPEALQLFPTVAATRTEYARAHRSSPARYLDHFAGPGRGRVIADVSQSAAGQWCYRMSQRNMIVEVTGEVPSHDGFVWLTFGQLYALLHRGKVLGAGLRSLLALLPPGEGVSDGAFHKALRASGDATAGALRPDSAVAGWLTEQRSYREVEVMPVPLNQVAGWHATGMEIARADGRYFSVIGVAGGGEHVQWSQPMIELRGVGLAALVVKEFDGVLHVLARASMESGLRDSVEIGPTVHCQPKEFERDTGVPRPFLLDYVQGVEESQVRYNVVHTGDGSVFFHADCRYLIVEADDKLPPELPPEFAWIALGQLADLIGQGHRVSQPARMLYACLNSLHQAPAASAEEGP
ncbi:MAG TPA: NDP-hexose 2,3-dehydratase family protein [Candidatus Limnocylindrales bacterium]|nr:NDP-hexose 2,3-dehydratase family protein [Candidatus Limnocylindrales bacterium]